MRKLNRKFGSFLRDEGGIVLAETLITLPLLVWALVAMFVYWETYRTDNTSQKAAYSIADLISRQKAPVNKTYIDGLQNILAFLLPGSPNARMRITSFEYDADDDKYVMLFSESPQDKVARMTDAELQALKPQVPVLSDLESVFLVETWVDFRPRLQTGLLGFPLGLNDMTFYEFIITSPRHRRICLAGSTACS